MMQSVKNRLRDLLVRSQRYTGTNNVYIAKHGFWTTAGFFLNSAISLVTVVAFANLIRPEMYGTYKYLLAIIGSLTFLTLSGVNTAVAEAVSRGEVGVLRYSVRLQLKWNALMMVAGLAIAGWYAFHGNWVFAASLSILSISVPLYSAFNTFGPYLTGIKDFRRSAAISVVSTIFGSSINLLAILLTNSIVLWIAAYALGTLLPCIYFYRKISHSLPPAPSESERAAFVRFTSHLSFLNVLSVIGQYLDKILTFQYVGPAALAVYAFAAVGSDQLKGWLKSLSGIAFPRLVESSLAEIDRVFYKRLAQAMLLGLAAAILYSLAAPVAFKLLFPKYLESIRYSQALSFSMIGVMGGAYAGNIFSAQRMLRTIYLSATGAHSLRIILFVVLGYTWGIWGMVAATLVAQAVGVMYNCLLWESAMRRAGLRNIASL